MNLITFDAFASYNDRILLKEINSIKTISQRMVPPDSMNIIYVHGLY